LPDGGITPYRVYGFADLFLPDGGVTSYPAYGFTDVFLPDGGVTPYPAYGFVGVFLPDGGVNALSGLRVCGHLFAGWRRKRLIRPTGLRASFCRMAAVL